MEEIEAELTEVPEFTKVSLSFVSPGEDLAGFETYTGDATKPVIRTSKGPSPSQIIVLGTSAFGVRCLFQDRIKGFEDKPRTLLAARIFMEANLRHIFGIQEEKKTTTMSNRSVNQPEDGRDPEAIASERALQLSNELSCLFRDRIRKFDSSS
jgi:hypothetical protein